MRYHTSHQTVLKMLREGNLITTRIGKKGGAEFVIEGIVIDRHLFNRLDRKGIIEDHPEKAFTYRLK